MRVLVVEDEPHVATVLQGVLLELGHEPLVVRNSVAALARIEADWPDAILLEIGSQNLSGLDFLRHGPLRQSAVPVVAMSRVATESQARESLRLGAVDFLSKPVDPERLREVLVWIEPHALARRLVHAGPERRRSPRIRVSFPVRVRADDGSEWHVAAYDLSPFGVRVAGGLTAATGSTALVALALPDGEPPLLLPSVLLRAGADGYAFSFTSVGATETRRLAEFTRR